MGIGDRRRGDLAARAARSGRDQTSGEQATQPLRIGRSRTAPCQTARSLKASPFLFLIARETAGPNVRNALHAECLPALQYVTPNRVASAPGRNSRSWSCG